MRWLRSRRIIGMEPGRRRERPPAGRPKLGGDAHDRPAWPCARRALAATGPAPSRVRRRGRPGRGSVPICEDVRDARRRGAARPQRAVRRRPSAAAAGPAPRRCRRRWTASTRTSGPRWRSRSAAPGSSTRPAPHRRHDAGRRPAARSPSAGCRSTGSASTCPAGSPSTRQHVVMNVVPAQEAGVPSLAVAVPAAAGHRRPAAPRRSSPPAPCSASTRSTPSAARRRSRCSPTATPTRRRAGCGRSTWSPARATSTSPRPSGCCTGLIGIDAEAGPTEIAILADDTRRPGARRRRPDQPGRARPAGRRVLVTDCERWPTRSSAELRAPGRGHQARRADPHRPDRPAVRDRPGRRRGRRPAGRRRLRRRAPGDPDRATPPRVAARVRNAGAVFVGPYSPVSLGDYCAGSNHVLPTGGCACHSAGCPCSPSCAASTSSTTTRPRCPSRAAMS